VPADGGGEEIGRRSVGCIVSGSMLDVRDVDEASIFDLNISLLKTRTLKDFQN